MIKTGLLLLMLNFNFVRVIPSTIEVEVMNYWDVYSNANFNIAYFLESLQHKFQQNLDHFDGENVRKWNQRYWVNSSWYKPGGPAFLFVNGEWTAEANWTIGYAKYWVSYAKELNAFCFSLEHRFYGKSVPEKPDNLLRYLNSGQAVADIANFIQGATEEFKLPKDIKWVVFGCSYAGSLAAWARLKYPHLVFGAVASSAPLLAKVDFSEYQQVIEKSLNSYHPKCVESIASAFQEVVRLNGTEAGRKNITKTFNLRENETANVLENVFTEVENILSMAVQHSYVNRIGIPFVCSLMVDNSTTKYESLAKLKKRYDALINSSTDDEVRDNNKRFWQYQTCSEFGFFQTFGEKLALYARNYSYSIETAIQTDCEKFFGSKFSVHDLDERVRHTNMIYGGLDFNVDKTVFVHGSLDPWHVLGLHKMKNDSLYRTVFIKGGSHCSEMYDPSDYPNYYFSSDIPEVYDARKEILDILKDWLKK